ncbi:hypothetical protein [Aquimarina latercula]|uniref:hypothetical protein n=1 Tax=Aquimarina latercula TaxID=987 RepID=UPI00041D9710|nr:hypothetical protein [Aquimarina latercula]
MKKLTLLFFLIIASYQCNSQSIETTLYIKEELVKQRDELLKKAEEIQKRIDAIDQKLGNKSNSKSSTQYITKTVNYNSLNSSTTKKKRNKLRATRRYIRGSRGGCYYINSNGNKTYVDRSICN